jgi:hypothetical protein
MKILPQVLLVVLALPILDQVQLKKTDRPVFRSVKEVASDCRSFLKLSPNGDPLPVAGITTTTMDQIVEAARCTSYLAGVEDGRLNASYGEKYHPVPTQLESFGTIVITFVKYADDHPEQQDFAASTVFDKSMRLIIDAQGQTR